MEKCVKVTISNAPGCYYDKWENIPNIIDGEFDGAEPGFALTLTLVEMSQEEIESLEEFTGW